MKKSSSMLPGKLLLATMVFGALLLTACHKDPPEDTTPLITAFSPVEGPEGATVVITGNHFSTSVTGNTVKFNGVAAEVVTSGANELTVKVPEGATTGKIIVTVGGKTVTSTNPFTVNPSAPAITSFTPTQGITGATVQITGSHFAPNSEVYFGAVKATEVTYTSSTQLMVKIPVTAVSGKIKIVANVMETLSASDFIVLPTTISFSPTHGEPGSAVTLTGTGFSTGTEVFVNGIAVASADYIIRQSDKIEVKIPALAKGGKIKIRHGGIDYEFPGTYEVTNIWIPVSLGFPGYNQYQNGFNFVYNNKVYVGGGADNNGTGRDICKMYDPATNVWSDGPSLPAALVGRTLPAAVVNNGKVYIGNGNSGSGPMKDWWEFDPASNNWRQLTDFTNSGYGLTAFSIGGKLYAGQGSQDPNIYEFDPAANGGLGAWNARIVLNIIRKQAASFVMNDGFADMVYIATGFDNAEVPNSSMTKYHIYDNGYTPTGVTGINSTVKATAISLHGKGYLLSTSGNFYEYTSSGWAGKTKPVSSNIYNAVLVADGKLFAITDNSELYRYIPSY